MVFIFSPQKEVAFQRDLVLFWRSRHQKKANRFRPRQTGHVKNCFRWHLFSNLVQREMHT